MSRLLAQALAQGELVATGALNEALQRQVVFGGSLDTSLLELGAVEEKPLIEAIGKALGLPTAGRAEIDETGEHIPQLFPLVFAETYHLVPYRLVDEELWVLAGSEPDEQLLQRIHERLRLRVRPVATVEARLHYAMHRLYGTALLPRFANLLTRLDGEVTASPVAGEEHVLSWGLSSKVIAPTTTRSRENQRKLDVRGLLARLDTASDRETIVEVLLGASLAVFDFAGLFAVHGDVVNGWRGQAPELTQRLARISLNVELPSVFQTIYATGGHYLGPLQLNSANTRLLSEMGRRPPRAALLAPISVGGRLAAILYADNGPRVVSSKRVAAVLLLAQRAGMAFERLIRSRKAQPQTMPEPEPMPPGVMGPITVSAEGESWVVHEGAPMLAAPTAVVAEPRRDELAPSRAPPSAPEPAAAPAREPWGTVRLSDVEGAEVDIVVEDEIILEPEDVEPGESDADGGEGYRAFSDVSDSPKDALDDWQDVLIETAGLDPAGASTAGRRTQSAPPSVTWDDVIAEAERAQGGAAPSGPIQVAGTVVDTRELLFDSLDAQDADVRRGAVEKLLALGSTVDDALRERFPGRVAFDPLAPGAALPPFRACSGLLELAAARGPGAAPIVLPHLESPDPTRRLFAIYYLHSVPYPPALGSLARRLYDSEPKNRYLAAEALRGYAREPGYAHVVQSLRDQLKVPIIESQVATIQILGQLREPSAVPSLIPLVVAKRTELAGAAVSALAVICGQAFGNDVARWAEWWQTHYDKARPAWLVESLRHPISAMARLAHNELAIVSGRPLGGFDPEGSAAAREAVIHGWESWWQQASRAYAGRSS